MVRAAVLDDGAPHFDFPFKHAHHKLSVKQELSTAVGYGCRGEGRGSERETKTRVTCTQSLDVEH